MPTSPEIDTLIARLEKLERQNRRWRRGAAAVLLAAGSLVLMAQAKAGSSPKVVQAAAFELVDKTGKVIAALDGRDAPARVKLNVSDGAGNDRFHLIVTGDGSLMRLAGPTDRTASLVVGANGPALLLEEPGRKAQVTLAIGQKGAVLSLTDQDQLGAALVTGPQGRAVAVYDANGKPVWSMPQ